MEDFTFNNISVCKESDINERKAIEAYTVFLKPIKCIYSAFLYFAALNFINAYVKLENTSVEFKKHYQFKHYVSLGIEQIIARKITGIEIFITKQVTYIKFNEIQFSFHNITITPLLKSYMFSLNNRSQEWSNIRLQPLANEIYNYSKILCNENSNLKLKLKKFK